MALKITTEISTDRGVTSEAYVRITSYSVTKTGYANFQLQTFLSEAEATPGYVMNLDSAKNYQIGETLGVSLVPVSEEPTLIPDFTPLETVSIFDYGYAQLKVKLQSIFGEANVVDC